MWHWRSTFMNPLPTFLKPATCQSKDSWLNFLLFLRQYRVVANAELSYWMMKNDKPSWLACNVCYWSWQPKHLNLVISGPVNIKIESLRIINFLPAISLPWNQTKKAEKRMERQTCSYVYGFGSRVDSYWWKIDNIVRAKPLKVNKLYFASSSVHMLPTAYSMCHFP